MMEKPPPEFAKKSGYDYLLQPVVDMYIYFNYNISDEVLNFQSDLVEREKNGEFIQSDGQYDFTEATKMVQGTTTCYAKKVDFLMEECMNFNVDIEKAEKVKKAVPAVKIVEVKDEVAEPEEEEAEEEEMVIDDCYDPCELLDFEDLIGPIGDWRKNIAKEEDMPTMKELKEKIEVIIPFAKDFKKREDFEKRQIEIYKDKARKKLACKSGDLMTIRAKHVRSLLMVTETFMFKNDDVELKDMDRTRKVFMTYVRIKSEKDQEAEALVKSYHDGSIFKQGFNMKNDPNATFTDRIEFARDSMGRPSMTMTPLRLRKTRSSVPTLLSEGFTNVVQDDFDAMPKNIYYGLNGVVLNVALDRRRKTDHDMKYLGKLFEDNDGWEPRNEEMMEDEGPDMSGDVFSYNDITLGTSRNPPKTPTAPKTPKTPMNRKTTATPRTTTNTAARKQRRQTVGSARRNKDNVRVYPPCAQKFVLHLEEENQDKEENYEEMNTKKKHRGNEDDYSDDDGGGDVDMDVGLDRNEALAKELLMTGKHVMHEGFLTEEAQRHIKLRRMSMMYPEEQQRAKSPVDVDKDYHVFGGNEHRCIIEEITPETEAAKAVERQPWEVPDGFETDPFEGLYLDEHKLYEYQHKPWKPVDQRKQFKRNFMKLEKSKEKIRNMTHRDRIMSTQEYVDEVFYRRKAHNAHWTEKALQRYIDRQVRLKRRKDEAKYVKAQVAKGKDPEYVTDYFEVIEEARKERVEKGEEDEAEDIAALDEAEEPPPFQTALDKFETKVKSYTGREVDHNIYEDITKKFVFRTEPRKNKYDVDQFGREIDLEYFMETPEIPYGMSKEAAFQAPWERFAHLPDIPEKTDEELKELTPVELCIYFSRMHYQKMREEAPKIAARAAAWNAKLKPLLAAEEGRPEFGIHNYGSGLLDNFEFVGQTKSLADLMGPDVQRWEIGRYFLASLMMTNLGNVEVLKENGEMKVKLISMDRHHDIFNKTGAL